MLLVEPGFSLWGLTIQKKAIFPKPIKLGYLIEVGKVTFYHCKTCGAMWTGRDGLAWLSMGAHTRIGLYPLGAIPNRGKN
jgi:hypothetical protein